MFCTSCGGEYADWVQKCPYCGSVNEHADEKKYLTHLEELRLRLDQVDEESEFVYRARIGHSMKKTSGIILIFAACLMMAAAVGMLLSARNDRKEEQRQIRQMQWERENFPIFDQWYRAGEYDRIMDAFYAQLDDSDASIYSWPHYYFVCDFYQSHCCIQEAAQTVRSGEIPESYILGDAIYNALRLRYEVTDAYLRQLRSSYDSNGCYGITEEELPIVQGYRAEADVFFAEALHWSDEEVEAFYKSCAKDGYLSVVPCFDKADEVIKNWK